jgi:hypothetical protein
MTCASCAARVEKKLNKLPGVAAASSTHREGDDHRCRRPRGPDRCRGSGRLHRDCGHRRATSAGPGRVPNTARSGRGYRRPEHSDPVAVALHVCRSRRVALGCAGLRHSRRDLGSVAVSPRHRRQMLGTAHPPWTRWYRSASPPRTCGRRGRSCSAGARSTSRSRRRSACSSCSDASSGHSRTTSPRFRWRAGLSESDDRRCRDGLQFRTRGDEQPAVGRFQPTAAGR